MSNDIAIIGMAGSYPGAIDLKQFWDNLVQGKDNITDYPDSRVRDLESSIGGINFEIAKGGYVDSIFEFDPGHFKISEEEAKIMDPQQRLALLLAERAISDSGYTPETLSGKRVGVFMGYNENQYRGFIKDTPLNLGNTGSASLAARIAYTYNFNGPVSVFATACSSSLTALHYGRNSLILDECDIAIVGATHLSIVPPVKEAVLSMPITSNTQRLRAFDENADGTIFGEGGSVILLRRADEAVENNDLVHAIIKSCGINHNGRRSSSLNVPSQEGQTELMKNVIKNANIAIDEIQYIEAHGTGTVLGDSIEIESMKQLKQDCNDGDSLSSKLLIGSVKTNIGHLANGAGLAGLVKVVLSLKNRTIPPSINFSSPNDSLKNAGSIIEVVEKQMKFPKDEKIRAGVHSLGLTGTNSFAVLEEAPQMGRRGGDCVHESHIVTVSAKSEALLKENLIGLNQYLEENRDIQLGDISFTQNTGRRVFDKREAFVAYSVSDLKSQLERAVINCDSLKQSRRKSAAMGNRMIAFILPDYTDSGQLDMVESFDHGFKSFYRIYKDQINDENHSIHNHFAMNYALFNQLGSIGINPKAILGIGRSKILSEIMKGNLEIKKGNEFLNSFIDNPITDKQIEAVVENMLGQGFNRFVILGEKCKVSNKIQKILGARSIENIVLFPENNSYISFLKQFYHYGGDIKWDNYYRGMDVKRLSIPCALFDLKKYIVDKNNILDFGSNRRLEKKEPGVEHIGFSRQDILKVFNENASEKLDPGRSLLDQGVDSITIMQIMDKLRKEYKISTPMDLYYESSTIIELVDNIVNNGKSSRDGGIDEVGISKSSLNESGYKSIEVPVYDHKIISLEKSYPENILLAGSTGFLGIHILRDLIEKTDAKIYCLVRGDNREGIEKRMGDKLKFYFENNYSLLIGERIIPVLGDVTEAHLGIDGDRYKVLSGSIDTVVNCAASVIHYARYSDLRRINTDSVANLLSFCFDGCHKIIHHMSTTAVIGVTDKPVVFREKDHNVGQLTDEMRVYGRTKFEAEHLINEARGKGLQACIYRIGNIIGRSSDGFFQENIEENRFYNNLKAIVELGILPETAREGTISALPVDYCSNSVVDLMLLKDVGGHNFHMDNTENISDFIETLNSVGSAIEFVESNDFRLKLEDAFSNSGFKPEISFLVHSMGNDEDEERELFYIPEFDTYFTTSLLKLLGNKLEKMDIGFIQKITDHCIKVNFLDKFPCKDGKNRLLHSRQIELEDNYKNLSGVNLEFLDYVHKTDSALDNSSYSDINMDGLALNPWPVFIDSKIKGRLSEASKKTLELIMKIPFGFFEGDKKALSDYFSLSDDTVEKSLLGFNERNIMDLLGRGDFVLTNDGYKCIEFNISGNLGGFQIGFIEEMYVNNPIIKGFIEENELFPKNEDLLIQIFELVISRSAEICSSVINLAIVDVIPDDNNMEGELCPINRIYQQVLKSKNLTGELVFCTFDDLNICEGELKYNGLTITSILERCLGLVPDEILDLHKSSKILMFNGPMGNLLSSKLTLAFLSEYQDSDIFNKEDQDLIRSYIPWTRKAINREVEIDSERIMLKDYTRENRNDLVLKYTESSGGYGIHIGQSCTDENWIVLCEKAFNEPYWIVQELLESQPLLLLKDNNVVEYDYVWGSFVIGSEYCGSFLRTVPFQDSPNIINSSNGAEETIVLEV